MSDDKNKPADKADELLRQAKALQEKARSSGSDADAKGTDAIKSLKESFDQVSWLGSKIRRAREVAHEAGEVAKQVGRYLGPVTPLVRGFFKGTGFVLHRASHSWDDESGEFEFSPKKAARSLLIAALMPVAGYTYYNLSTRRDGTFIINDKQLISGETDEYQLGGCWQSEPNQTVCKKSEGEIVLLRPSWFPGTGVSSWTYDEDVGVVPLQGKCEMETYGIYLRKLPLIPFRIPFLQGSLKPVAIGIGDCHQIGAGASSETVQDSNVATKDMTLESAIPALAAVKHFKR